jgi:hypothetical protein
MATPDSPEAGQADPAAAPGPTLPGHTVDALRLQGKPAEARAEFERLIVEGAGSGIDSRSPAAILDGVREEIRNRATTQTGDRAGDQT